MNNMVSGYDTRCKLSLCHKYDSCANCSFPTTNKKKKSRSGNYKYRQLHTICEQCGKPSKMTHHIIPVSKGGDNDYSNLKALCYDCHGEAHPELPNGLKENWRKENYPWNQTVSHGAPHGGDKK